MNLLIIAEHDQTNLSPNTLRAVQAVQSLALETHLVVMAATDADVFQAATQVEGIAQVIAIEDPSLTTLLPELMVPTLQLLAKDYVALCLAASSFGKNLLPRLAAALDVGQVSDVVELLDLETMVHPVYAGNALEKVKILDAQKVFSIRASAFAPAKQSDQPVQRINRPFQAPSHVAVRLVSEAKNTSERPPLNQAKVVVSGGRGLKNQANFQLIEALADTLQGAVGASRAAVDAGFVSNDLQVGQTGVVVAPDLYVAVGISGAVQHVAGMKSSKIIVAINKDPDAPIFQVADYGLQEDLFQALPELIDELKGQKVESTG
jgi:electron transfer flavoprotein alpha subunit